jgi:hypothetical protein
LLKGFPMFADLSHFAKEVIDGMVGHLLGDVHQTAPSYASVRLVFYICLLIDLALILWLRRRRKERDAGRAELEDRIKEEIEAPSDQRTGVPIGQRTNEIRDKLRRLDQEVRQQAVFFGLMMTVQLSGLLIFLQKAEQRWQITTALLPLLLVIYHAGNVWAEAPSSIAPALPKEDASRDTAQRKDRIARITRIRDQIAYSYGWQTIFVRYTVPAALVTLVGLVALWLATATPPPPVLSRFLGPDQPHAFHYGVLGAYLYVFLELGRRSVRHDITPMAILWCLITLVVGPPLAALMPFVFNQVGASDSSLWNQKAVWVLAGYSPRVVFRTLSAGALKALHADESSIQEDRRISLGRVQGIGIDEAERLAEEGITDVHALACVDPLRLMRDTRFDNWRILSWVDQALLITVVPEAVWRALLKYGYQGGTDISNLLDRFSDGADKPEETTLGKVAGETGLGLKNLWSALAHLLEDTRLRDLNAIANFVVSGAPLSTRAYPWSGNIPPTGEVSSLPSGQAPTPAAANAPTGKAEGGPEPGSPAGQPPHKQ